MLTVVILLGAIGVATRLLRDRPVPGGARWPAEGRVTLAVEAFHALDPQPRSWMASTFAESLAARLERLPGLDVHVAAGGDSRSDFTLRGDVTSRDGRLVIAARLYSAGNQQPMWTATFWRSDEPSPNLVADLAADVAEALYGRLGRSAISTTGESK